MPDAETGALSVDQAVQSLLGEPQLDETPKAGAAPEEAAVEAEDIQDPQGETSSPEDAEDGAETPAEDAETEEAQEEAVEPLDPPKYWSQDAKAKFAQLPPELQAVVLAQEGPREEAAAKAKAEAARQIEAAQKDVEGIKTLAEQLGEFLPQAVETFKTRWGEPDWAKVAEEYGADQAFVLKAQHDAEKARLQQLAESTQKAQEEARKADLQAQWRMLAEREPDLAPDVNDPAKGVEKRQSVGKHLLERGYTQEAISQMSALDMSVAYDAMRWREAQAKVQAVPKKPVAAPPKTAVRSPAAQPAATPQRIAQQAKNRFAQTRSVEDAIALLASQGG